MKPVRPEIPPLQEYDEIELLKKEKELVGMYISSHPLDKFRFEFDNLVTVELSEVRNIEDNLSRDPKLRNIEFTVGGLVTDVQVKYTRTGNRPWCTFTVEDFNGSHNFSLSGKSYEAYMQYMVDHTALLIRCVTKELFRKEAVENKKGPEYRLFIANMTLLSNAKEQFFKEFHISMDLEQSDAGFRKALTKKLRAHKGETPLFIDLSFDHNGGKETVSLYSNKFRVSVDGELVDWLYEQGLDCRVVKKMTW
jgi:DNA polymerase-3 subunit alpha